MIVSFKELTKKEQEKYIQDNFYDLTKKRENMANGKFMHLAWEIKKDEVKFKKKHFYIQKDHRDYLELWEEEGFIFDPEKIIEDVWLEVKIDEQGVHFKEIVMLEPTENEEWENDRQILCEKLISRYNRMGKEKKKNILKMKWLFSRKEITKEWLYERITEENIVTKEKMEQLKDCIRKTIERKEQELNWLWRNEKKRGTIKKELCAKNKLIKI